ncbi:MAG TPA: bacillithiol biosynthesis cysteine-adding enzyme BshC [Candidatus Angelobacter sp.]|nr:bacillithiol biosynthesis cysteine-adding enzyme BshC [Candidatus Angelobacter sp.]
MQPECIPFSSIPHQTRLFTDFLHHFDRVQAFYACPPQIADWFTDERERINMPPERRSAVADALERINRGFGAGPKTFDNLQRLKDGAPVVVTGQQVALFGGPLFSLLKVLSVAMLAERTNAVPVFWLATEDHDLQEVNFAQFPSGDGLQTLRTEPPHTEGAPVGTIAFSEEIGSLLDEIEKHFGSSEVLDLVRSSYRAGANFGDAFGKLFSSLFAQFGLVLLNPADAELHRIARPVYRDAFVHWKEINDALRQRDQELESAGYHAQVKVTHSHTLCFYLHKGARIPIRHDGQDFVAGELRFSHEQLVAEAENHPERFSANVLLRPIVQDYLLPTLCYAGGPAEIAYFAQVAAVYKKLLGRVTPVVPRIFATLVEARQAKLLDRYQLTLLDVFRGPEKLHELVAAKALPESMMRSFDLAVDHLEQALAAIAGPLQKLDASLADAAENAGSKMRYQLQSLRDKAARAESRKNTETQRHADELSTLLYPNKNLQEREITGIYFLLKHGTGLLQRLREKLKPGCPDHQVVLL